MTAARILLAWTLVLGAPAAALAQTDEPATDESATDDTATAETQEPAAPTTMREAAAERQEPATAMRPATTMAVDEEAAARREAARERFLERQRARQEAARAREARVTETAPPVREPVQPGPAQADEADEIAEEDVAADEAGALGDQPPAQAMEDDLHDQPVDEVYHEVHGDAQQAEEGELLDHGNTEAASEDVAEHEGAHGADVHLSDVFSSIEFWGSVVNFTLLVVLIVFLARKPMKSFLSSRRQSIEEGLAEAKRLREAAQARYDEYSERLEKLDREIEAIRKDMVAAGEAERDRIVADAEAKAARMRREAEFLIEQQMKQLRVDLTREAVEAAVNAAEEVLTAKTSTQDQQRLAQQYLERLAQDANQEAAQ